MKICKKCMHNDVCENVMLKISAYEHEKCVCYKNDSQYVKLPCLVGGVIYFIGYGIVEELIVTKISMEFSETFMDDSLGYLGYVDARRLDGTTESIGFNTFGELAFIDKEEAEKALNKEEPEKK